MSVAGDKDDQFAEAGGIKGYKIPTWKGKK
jgi:hypothetical protein